MAIKPKPKPTLVIPVSRHLNEKVRKILGETGERPDSWAARELARRAHRTIECALEQQRHPGIIKPPDFDNRAALSTAEVTQSGRTLARPVRPLVPKNSTTWHEDAGGSAHIDVGPALARTINTAARCSQTVAGKWAISVLENAAEEPFQVAMF